MEEYIQLAHGGGGLVMGRLIKDFIRPRFKVWRVLNGVGLGELDDGASMPLEDFDLVISTDGHTVDPIFFPGGDIGRLAVAGTCNDVSVMGAKPMALTCSLIIEEGFPLRDLDRILRSMNEVAEEVEVAVVGGDTKVMPKGHLDKIVIVTTVVGLAKKGCLILDSGLKDGDKIIVSGTIGDHGIALASVKQGIEFETTLVSDVGPVWSIIEASLNIGGVTAAKDPTRGGLAGALNEMAEKSEVSIWIDESKVPIRREVQSASEMLGLNPLEVTCEGKVVLGVKPDKAEEVLKAVRKTRYGGQAEIIGEVRAERAGYVIVETIVGGKRILEKPIAEPTPRVC